MKESTMDSIDKLTINISPFSPVVFLIDAVQPEVWAILLECLWIINNT